MLYERKDEILEITRKINFSNLIQHYKGQSPPISFTEFENL